ncbi:3-methyladenine DNA glycosylase [Kocuria coralli]|uniref:3-methyladenine DNA glycosylase n=1 Tax=Kocuria coralli TaxID=1461025 RepID=A0A5J5KXX9_9MICC|nr:3-methyladenine DNA glycosylase [Kocuria coralli]KAA9394372.1 3-methyladenine DNA glycosylase [Kocuria coralli]
MSSALRLDATAPVLRPEQWRQAQSAHLQRVQDWTEPFRERRNRGLKHPVDDFLFTYYSFSPGKLERWTPGAGVVLLDGAAEFSGRKFWRTLEGDEAAALGIADDEGAVTLDLRAFLSARGSAVQFVDMLVRRTAGRPGVFGCFGLHEWAMAYRAAVHGVRHEQLPLRLGSEGTDAVVESHKLKCTHIDAFRFFAPEAAPRNELQPTRETQRELEQPGCLHATMDLYKWAYKLYPAVPSQLIADAFALAVEVRATDMEASPYDLSDWGYGVVAVETPQGKAEYVRRQKSFAERARPIRERLLECTTALLSSGPQ